MFHRFGVRTGRKYVNGESVPMHKHKFKRWRQSEPVSDMVHLSDTCRIRIGMAVVNFLREI